MRACVAMHGEILGEFDMARGVMMTHGPHADGGDGRRRAYIGRNGKTSQCFFLPRPLRKSRLRCTISWYVEAKPFAGNGNGKGRKYDEQPSCSIYSVEWAPPVRRWSRNVCQRTSQTLLCIHHRNKKTRRARQQTTLLCSWTPTPRRHTEPLDAHQRPFVAPVPPLSPRTHKGLSFSIPSPPVPPLLRSCGTC